MEGNAYLESWMGQSHLILISIRISIRILNALKMQGL
jgi:hypothetical protein